MMNLPKQYQGLHSFSLGDSPLMADSGLRDVVSGQQIATSGAFDILNKEKNEIPHEGKVEIVLDGVGNPGCAIKIWKADTKRFSEIDEKFAKDEACRDLAEWRTIHEDYFRRKGCYSPNMKIYRIYFHVVEVFKELDESATK